MAHYAFLDDENYVVKVIPGKDENQGTDWEEVYGQVEGLTCKRTSYNTVNNKHLTGGTPFRGNYAGIGYKYDQVNDVFIPPKPYPSWVLDTSIWNYKAPVLRPTPEQSENRYINWDEPNLRWIDIISSDYWDPNTQTWLTT